MRKARVFTVLIFVFLISFTVGSSEPLNLMHPLYSDARIIQYFDKREDSKSNSVIWAVPTGTPVKAAASGVVIKAGLEAGYGMQVIIDHGNGIETHYARLSKFLVTKGEQVAQGQVIAYSGNTGASSEPSLCFELWRGATAENPLDYISKGNAEVASPTPPSTYNNQPMGMDGWAWGTPIEQVAGWLAYGGTFDMIPGSRGYTRTDIKCSYLGGGWSSQFHVFLNGKYAAIFLSSSIQYAAYAAQMLMEIEHGEPTIYEENNGVGIALWSGQVSSIIMLATFSGADQGVQVIIGTPEFMYLFAKAMNLELKGQN